MVVIAGMPSVIGHSTRTADSHRDIREVIWRVKSWRLFLACEADAGLVASPQT